MSAKEHGEGLVYALVVAGVCLGVFLLATRGSDPNDTIGTLALIIGSGAVLVAAFRALALILGGLARVSELPGERARSKRYRAEAAARDERWRRLEASRERHRANRSTWLRRAREWIATEGPAWQGGTRDAFVWLRARLGKTVTIRRRQEDRMERDHWGRNSSEPKSVAPGEWEESKWVVELPDEALTAKEHDDRVDEAEIVVRWRVANAVTLPITQGTVTVDAKGVEIRVPETFNELNDLDYGETGTYTDVIHIGD